nr:hypothetical protein [Micropruina sp.]
GETTAITIWNIYKAALAAGEDWATRCRDAVEAAGCDLMTANRSHKDKRTGEVYCVGTIRRAVAAGQDRAVTAALRGLRVSASGEGPELWNARVVEPWINALAERPALVERRRPEEIAGVIDATDIWAVLDRVTAFIANRRRAGTPCASFRDLLQAELGTLLDKAFLANTIRAAE